MKTGHARWKVQNIDYDFEDLGLRKLTRIRRADHPWRASSSARHVHYFATYAEAIAHADKQARRNQ